MTTIVNLGVDSVAMLIGPRAANRRPDRIVFADTGSENPETYDYSIARRPTWAARDANDTSHIRCLNQHRTEAPTKTLPPRSRSQ